MPPSKIRHPICSFAWLQAPWTGHMLSGLLHDGMDQAFMEEGVRGHRTF